MSATTKERAFRETRRRFIGGTDIGAIIGVSPWATPLSVYFDKTDQGEPVEETLAMRRGKALEHFISREFVREHPELVVDLHPDPVIRDDWGFPAGASLDGICRKRRQSEPVAIFEAKTTSAWNAKAWDAEAGDLPDTYFTQVQWYLAVADLPLAYAAADVGDPKKLRVVEVPRDEAVIEALIRAGRDFWVAHVETHTPPAPSGHQRDGQALRAIYPRSSPDVSVVLGDEAAALVEAYRDAAFAEKTAAEAKAAAQNQLCALLGDAETAVAGGHKISWKSQTRTTLDGKALKADAPEIWRQYARTSEPRAFRISEVKT